MQVQGCRVRRSHQVRAHRRRAGRGVASLMLAATLPVLSMTLPPTASAAPAGAVVVIGDSFATNHSDDLGPACGHSPTSWPARLARRTGDHLINVSCSGASLFGRYNVYDQAKKAQKRNGFGPRTRAVLVQLGFNDWSGNRLHGRCVATECAHDGKLRTMTAATYAGRLRALVDYVRFYAPKAAIRIVGYPELFADGAHNLCTNVAGTKITKPQTRAAVDAELSLRNTQSGAADILGTGFVDARAVTAGHGMCSTDPWVRGVMYPRPGLAETLMVRHPTEHGDLVLAKAVADSLDG